MSCHYRFLPRYRLKKSTQYQAVFKKADKFVSRYFVIFLTCNRQSSARLGIVVTKKCSKRAVIRNQLKRIIRESFRHHYLLIKGYDVVVIARKSIIWLDKITVRGFLDRQWSKLSVRRAT